MGKKNYANVAPETNFGVPPATGWHGMAVEDLGGHNAAVVTQQPKTMVYGQQGPLASGRRTSVRGSTGSLKPYAEFDSPANLLMLEQLFGPPVVTELVDGEAWERVYSSGGAAPSGSFSTQIGREFADGSQDRDTHVGGQLEKWTVTQGMTPASTGVTDEGLVKMEFAANYRTMIPGTERLPTYPASEVYSGSDWTLSVGPDLDSLVANCLDSWGIEWNTGLDFEGARCASSTNRDKAGPGALPSGTMTGASSYKDRANYNAWLNGDILALRSEWKPVGVFLDAASTVNPSFTIDIPAFGFTGETPTESADSATKQNLPREILWNEVDDMITVTVVSSVAPA